MMTRRRARGSSDEEVLSALQRAGQGSLGHAITAIVLVTVLLLLALIGWPVVAPMWAQYRQTVHDCIDTPKSLRSAKQEESCKQRGRLLMPGVHY